MKSRLRIILLLLLVLNLDGIVLAEVSTGSSPLNPDGIAVSRQRRKRRRGRSSRKHTKVYGVQVSPDEAGAAAPPSAAPPPPVGSSPDMAPGSGRAPSPAKKSAPRIKPPTVQIKPPTE